MNKQNFQLEKVAESLVKDIDNSVKRDFLLLSETLNKNSKSAVDLFFTNLDTDTLNNELTLMKKLADDSDLFWEEYLHPFMHLT